MDNAGGFALGQWLDTMGVDVVYLPTGFSSGE